jgi:hypothetical protein
MCVCVHHEKLRVALKTVEKYRKVKYASSADER